MNPRLCLNRTWFGVLLSGASMIASADGTPPFHIESYATHDAGKIVYHYRLTNHSEQAIGAIGFGLHNSSDPPAGPTGDLAEQPSGTRRGEIYGVDGYAVIYDPNSFDLPVGWIIERGDVPEDDESGRDDRGGFFLDLRSDDSKAFIQPGQTLEGFSVKLDKPDHAGYLTGRSTILLTDATGKTVAHSIRATPIDTTAPSLVLKPLPSSVSKLGGSSLKVQMVVTVSDDYDPQSEIKLESITASVPMNQSEIKGAVFGTNDRLFVLPNKKDPTGKPVVYTITYSATDGTGNKATQSATVTLNP